MKAYGAAYRARTQREGSCTDSWRPTSSTPAWVPELLGPRGGARCPSGRLLGRAVRFPGPRPRLASKLRRARYRHSPRLSSRAMALTKECGPACKATSRARRRAATGLQLQCGCSRRCMLPRLRLCKLDLRLHHGDVRCERFANLAPPGLRCITQLPGSLLGLRWATQGGLGKVIRPVSLHKLTQASRDKVPPEASRSGTRAVSPSPCCPRGWR